ncbi:MAG: hypothetical protein AAGD25_08665 [Cyanobacteria bacterium P01_F01_bin.150]
MPSQYSVRAIALLEAIRAKLRQAFLECPKGVFNPFMEGIELWID